MTPYQILDILAQETDEIILFHSGTGKDSICLLDMCSKRFKKIVCILMYVVKDLEHIQKYIDWSTNKYPNCTFLQYPHFNLAGWIKIGHLGCKMDEKQKKYTLADINQRAVLNTGIEWTVFGMKQSDSMNRRLMLRTYEHNAIMRKTKKVYPLTEWKNKDVLKYIESNRLLRPIQYGDTKIQSSGVNPDSEGFLAFCREKYPNDLKKVIEYFPESEIILFNYEQKKQQL